ncbi:methyltransferase domain-containing protein [Castellaniella sp.]|uniref:methyltransferase domain-containing protein n=1 Tax=Castellaniella sp. TaxID=1955812 RepID=UPI002AFED10E|nr:methyltransferase domain-containing protein [Castellaniella sp.]
MADADAAKMRQLLEGMRAAFFRGDNAMEYARSFLGRDDNLLIATQIAYDLQAGSYVKLARANPEGKARWVSQIADLLSPHLQESGGSVLEVGVGEATTLSGVLAHLSLPQISAFGFDISWSRCAHGLGWLKQMGQCAELFVADLFHIPLADSSIDIVYTSHSLEPNGGRELEAIRELLRVARRFVVLIEPIYELGSAAAQARMRSHGYVRNLKKSAEDLGCVILDYRLLDYCFNPLNPSGVLLLEKLHEQNPSQTVWRCPLTHAPLDFIEGVFAARETGLIYPIVGGIPLLCRNNAILASSYGTKISES